MWRTFLASNAVVYLLETVDSLSRVLWPAYCEDNGVCCKTGAATKKARSPAGQFQASLDFG